MPATAFSSPLWAKNLPIWFAMYVNFSGDMLCPTRIDAMAVREYLESVVAGDRYKRHARSFGGAHGERRRGRDRNEYTCTDNGRLLDHFDGNPAGDENRASRGGDP